MSAGSGGGGASREVQCLGFNNLRRVVLEKVHRGQMADLHRLPVQPQDKASLAQPHCMNERESSEATMGIFTMSLKRPFSHSSLKTTETLE